MRDPRYLPACAGPGSDAHRLRCRRRSIHPQRAAAARSPFLDARRPLFARSQRRPRPSVTGARPGLQSMRSKRARTRLKYPYVNYGSPRRTWWEISGTQLEQPPRGESLTALTAPTQQTRGSSRCLGPISRSNRSSRSRLWRLHREEPTVELDGKCTVCGTPDWTSGSSRKARPSIRAAVTCHDRAPRSTPPRSPRPRQRRRHRVLRAPHLRMASHSTQPRATADRHRSPARRAPLSRPPRRGRRRGLSVHTELHNAINRKPPMIPVSRVFAAD
jgi:hypothetical protein